MNSLRRLLPRYGVLIALTGMCLVIGLLNPVFLSLANISNILVQATPVTIVAVGMTFVIVTGGIDLSVGSILAVSGMVLGISAASGCAIALMLALLTGLACGLVNGAVVAYGNVPPFVATLGMMGVARGLALMLTDGRSVSGLPSGLLVLATGAVLHIPLPVVVTAFVLLIGLVFLGYSYWGRYLYAIGDNSIAARLAGINVRRHRCAVYGVSGLLSSVAALVLTARLDAAQPVAGNSYELDAIAAVVIGGARLTGGRGTVTGTFLGAMVLTVLRNGLSIVNVSSYLQQIIIGGALVAAVLAERVNVQDE